MPDIPSLESLCVSYLQNLRQQKTLAATTGELSYRPFLDALLRGAAPALGKQAEITNEGKKQVYGKPDFIVTAGLKEIGSIEAEALGADLAHLTGHAKHQNERFRENIHNFLLTNHTDFLLYVDNKLVASASLPLLETGKSALPAATVESFRVLLERFFEGASPPAASPEQLARQLAKRAKELRFHAGELLEKPDSPLHPFWNAYKQTLYADLNAEKFADVYAQTFTYGLFLAWLGFDKGTFDRAHALLAIPDAVPPIQVLLEFGGGRKLPDELVWIVDGICSDLNFADKSAILKPFAQTGDPMVHFYETFLAAYDKKQRERVGVYYTPDAVVDFIVRAVDEILRRDFGKDTGLADPSVTLLDPATGTATFLAHAYRHVYQQMTEAGDGGVWPDRARAHLMRHFYGFELLPAAYTLAHIKLRALLAELNVPLKDDERLPVYLTNTLEEGIKAQIALPILDVLSKEVVTANAIKSSEPILVVLGNPPYSGHSANPSRTPEGELTWIGKLIETYRKVDGADLGERNPKWLQDDYVKFLRFAQWRIAQTSSGVVGFITNHGYLDNPTFRGMRRSLMQSFHELYFLDLHGNSKKKETAPGGGPDKNVFDIQQGVAICLLIKRPGPVPSAGGTVHHGDLFGPREAKYAALRELSLFSNPSAWEPLAPSAPFYLFRPQDQTIREEYEQGWRVPDIFPVNSVGIVTARDSLTIAWEKDEIWNTVTDFVSLPEETARKKYDLGDDARDWKITLAQEDLKKSGPNGINGPIQSKITPILYRPFDTRYTYFTGHSRGFQCMPRGDVMRHMTHKNLGLIVGRSSAVIGDEEWNVLGISRNIIDFNYFRRGGGQIHPLWLYPAPNSLETERRANISDKFLTVLAARIDDTPAPEDIFHYVYALFHAPAYRTRYAEFLKGDFPRLPLPPDAQTFRDGAKIGKKLVGLHLLKDDTLTKTGIGFPVSGGHDVKKIRAAERWQETGGTPGVGRVRLNETEYFDNVPRAVWEYRIGGYQPAAKWLDDRAAAGRALDAAEIEHYRRMIAAMRETIKCLPETNEIFARVMESNAAQNETDAEFTEGDAGNDEKPGGRAKNPAV